MQTLHKMRLWRGMPMTYLSGSHCMKCNVGIGMHWSTFSGGFYWWSPSDGFQVVSVPEPSQGRQLYCLSLSVRSTYLRRDPDAQSTTGPFGCLGRNLAMQELQIVASRLLLNYDLKFAPQFDSKKFTDGIENMRATIFRYPLTVVATRRNRDL